MSVPVRAVTLLVAFAAVVVGAVGAAASGTVLGLMRVFSPGLVYPAYLGFRHHVLSVVADQQVGGAVLWVIPLVPFSVLAVALVIGWLKEELVIGWLKEEEEAGARPAGADRLLRQRPAWPSRPGLR